jgi:hypothetical protein
VYVLKVEKSAGGKPLFTITPGDNPLAKIKAPSVAQAYSLLFERVNKANTTQFSHGDLFSKLPTKRRSRKKIFGLNGPQVRTSSQSHNTTSQACRLSLHLDSLTTYCTFSP